MPARRRWRAASAASGRWSRRRRRWSGRRRPRARSSRTRPSWRAFTGQSYEEWKGYGWLNAVHPEDRPRAEEAWRAAVAAKARTRLRTACAVPTGPTPTRWPAATPILADSGEIEESIGLNFDISDRVKAEASSRESERRLRLALEAGRMGTWEFDLTTGVVHWSAAIERMHGIAAGSFPGTFEAYQADLHPDDRAWVLATVKQNIARGTRAPAALPDHPPRRRRSLAGGVRDLRARRGRQADPADGRLQRRDRADRERGGAQRAAHPADAGGDQRLVRGLRPELDGAVREPGRHRAGRAEAGRHHRQEPLGAGPRGGRHPDASGVDAGAGDGAAGDVRGLLRAVRPLVRHPRVSGARHRDRRLHARHHGAPQRAGAAGPAGQVRRAARRRGQRAVPAARHPGDAAGVLRGDRRHGCGSRSRASGWSTTRGRRWS